MKSHRRFNRVYYQFSLPFNPISPIFRIAKPNEYDRPGLNAAQQQCSGIRQIQCTLTSWKFSETSSIPDVWTSDATTTKQMLSQIKVAPRVAFLKLSLFKKTEGRAVYIITFDRHPLCHLVGGKEWRSVLGTLYKERTVFINMCYLQFFNM